VKSENFLTISKFAFVGIANTFTGLAVIYLLKGIFSVGDAAANLLGYGVGLVISFLLNRSWTFRFLGATWTTLARFALIAFIGYALNLVTVLLAIDVFHFDGYLAQALGVPPYASFTYLGCRYFVFVPREVNGVSP